MEKRLNNMISFLQSVLIFLKSDDYDRNADGCEITIPAALNDADATRYKNSDALLRDILAQIQFLQHERLVHLIVTVTFAVLTLLSVIGFVVSSEMALIPLIILFLVLLVPYIRHYYILENGVQKLYSYYTEIVRTI